MSIIKPPTETRSWRPRLALFSAVSLGFTGGPVALAAPAQADTSDRGCTVDPLKPPAVARGNAKVDFKIKVDCHDDQTVQIRQLRYEDDAPP